jgi:small-conductance mechanosensitive channel
MAKGNDSPYALMPEDKVVIRNMDFLRFGRADITPLIGHYGPNYLFLRNDYNRSSFLFGGDYYITDSGISYKSDPELVRKIAVETSLEHPRVLANPEPFVLFSDYGDSRLDFGLYVSTIEPELTLRTKSDLYYMLWEKFAENNIQIPFPQRDLNLGNGWEKLTSNLHTL